MPSTEEIAAAIETLVDAGYSRAGILAANPHDKRSGTYGGLINHLDTRRKNKAGLLPTTAASHPFLRPEAQRFALQTLREKGYFDLKKGWTQTALIDLLKDFVALKWPGTPSRASSRDHEAAGQIYRHWMASDGL